MAMGARHAAEKHGLNLEHIKFCGIDAMPQKGGGMELVAEGTLFASYTYPTRGDEVMLLAMNILEGKKYNRENQLSSALVTRDNARVLLMQNDETMRQQDHLSTLRSRVDKAASDFNTQRIYLLVLLVFVVLLIAVCAAAIYAFITRTRINQQLKASMDEQNRMTTEMEEMTQTQLQFFTNVSHELRTPDLRSSFWKTLRCMACSARCWRWCSATHAYSYNWLARYSTSARCRTTRLSCISTVSTFSMS